MKTELYGLFSHTEVNMNPLGIAGFLPNIQAFFAKYAIAALIIVVSLGGVYIKGRYDGSAKVEAEYANQKTEWVTDVFTHQSIFGTQANDILKDYWSSNIVYKDVIKYVKSKPEVITQYVPLEYDRKCEVPQGFVELHNKAAAGTSVQELQDIPTNYGVPSDKKLSDIARTVTINYTEYNDMKNQLISLQKTVRKFQEQQEALINEN